MTNDKFRSERRKQTRLEKLGTNEPRCGVCGENDWRCMELHHDAGQKNDPRTVIACANCHRKVTDMQKDHPAIVIGADPLLAAAGSLMLGLADMLSLIIAKLYEFGQALIDRANATASEQLGATS